jgi:predicted GH43/DUF377 family glycosyl hydrolase
MSCLASLSLTFVAVGGPRPAQADCHDAAQTWSDEWRPGNYDNRYPDQPAVEDLPPEHLPFMTPLVRDPRSLLGPEGDTRSAYQVRGAKQVFNPAGFVETDAEGRETVYLVMRSEVNKTEGPVMRESYPQLVEYRPGQAPIVHPGPMLPIGGIDAPWELGGGMEDFRFVDLSLRPAVRNGVTYKRMLTYVAYDGRTPRICGVLFNEASDLRPDSGKFLKIGPMFRDEDVMGSYAPDTAWNKSGVLLQFRDSQGKLRQVVWWNEGNHLHGGIWATEISGDPARWPLAAPRRPGQKPAITTRKGKFDQNLVEVAQVIVAPLPEALAARTGKKNGIYVLIHGDSPNLGYRVGYRIYDVDDPTGEALYESASTFLRVETREESLDGQVRRVVFAPSFIVTRDGTVHVFFGQGDKWIGHAQGKLL